MGEFLSLEGAAERLGVPESTLRQWIRRGSARATRRAGAYLVREREVERLLKRMAREGGLEPPPESPSLPESLELPVRPRREPETRAPGEEREVERLRALLAARESELEKLSDEHRQLRALPEEVSRLRARLEERQEELESLRLLRDEGEAQLESSQAELAASRERVAELESSPAELASDEGLLELADLRSGLRQQSERLAEEQQLRQAERAEWECRRAELEEAAERARRETQEQTRLNRELEVALRNLEDQLARERETAASRQGELAELRSRLESAAGDEQSRTRALEERIEHLQAELQEAARRNGELESQWQRRDDEERALQLQAQASRDAAAAAARLESEAARMTELLEKAQSRIHGLELESERSLARWEEREQQLESENRRLKEHLNSLQYRVQMAGEQTALQALDESRRLVDRIGELEETMAEKDRLIETGHRERSSLRTQLDDLRRLHYELEQRYEQEKGEWSALVAHQITKDRDKLMAPDKAAPQQSLLGWFRPKGDLP
ncbi:MAG: helix-turn-helix domain-containing protein [Armatimonadetes bacterium]|nr:helix-turn-helix domain-containing protein [Armatimonadota bacterium]